MSAAQGDLLQRYFDKIRPLPLLSREEELALATRYRKTGDREAFARLVGANLRLVAKIALEYRRGQAGLLDLIQEGNLGLLRAVERYDPAQNIRFCRYAAWWIRAFILRFNQTNRLIRVGTTKAGRRIFYRLGRERARLELLGLEPTPALLAERLAVSPEEIEDTERGLRVLSLDAPGADDGRPRLELLPEPGSGPEERLARAQEQRYLSALLENFPASLDERERAIYQERLLAESPLCLRELGDRFGVSRERVRQMERQIVEKARRYLQAQLA